MNNNDNEVNQAKEASQLDDLDRKQKSKPAIGTRERSG